MVKVLFNVGGFTLNFLNENKVSLHTKCVPDKNTVDNLSIGGDSLMHMPCDCCIQCTLMLNTADMVASLVNTENGES